MWMALPATSDPISSGEKESFVRSLSLATPALSLCGAHGSSLNRATPTLCEPPHSLSNGRALGFCMTPERNTGQVTVAGNDRSVHTQTLPESLLAGLETLACHPSLFCNAYARDSARGKLPDITANWNGQRATEGEPVLHIWGKRPLDTFLSYDYDRLPSIPFV